ASGAVGFDVRRQRAQRGEDPEVLLAVRTQLEAVALAHRQRQLQRVDRIQSETGVEQRCFGIDRTGLDVIQAQCLDQEFGKFAFGWGLCGHAAASVAAIILPPMIAWPPRVAKCTTPQKTHTPAPGPRSVAPPRSRACPGSR